eukprot:79426-Chlamydomonas_euryale.AAC.2
MVVCVCAYLPGSCSDAWRAWPRDLLRLSHHFSGRLDRQGALFAARAESGGGWRLFMFGSGSTPSHVREASADDSGSQHGAVRHASFVVRLTVGARRCVGRLAAIPSSPVRCVWDLVHRCLAQQTALPVWPVVC